MTKEPAQPAERARSASRATSLGDVARRAQVSITTASRVLHGSGGRQPSSELAARVLEAAEQLQYVPNVHAQLLARSARSGVGMIVNRIDDPHFGPIAQGAIDEGAERNEFVTIFDARQDPDFELKCIDLMIDQRVKVILLAGSGYTDPDLEARVEDRLRRFRDQGGVVVSLTRRQFEVATSRPDNTRGGELVAQHILQLAHRRLGFISGPVNFTTNQDRIDGFRSVLRRHDQTVDERLQVVEGDFTKISGYSGTQLLLGRDQPPTAIFCATDLMALGALAAARDMGVNVPGDVSVVGFGDIPAALDTYPTLTTVRTNLYEAGRRAVAVALSSSVDVRVDKVPCQLINRGSTGPAPAG